MTRLLGSLPWLPSLMVGVAFMGASWAAESVPSATWGPTWTVPVRIITRTVTIVSPPIIKRIPPDPARLRAMMLEIFALCDSLSQKSDERDECRRLAAREAVRWQ
jgi:hypothetical protein